MALRYNIVDKPNWRSSHTIPTTRGAGIIILIGLVTYGILSGQPFTLFVSGLFLAGIVGFIDDVKTLSGKIRLPFYLLASFLVMAGLDFTDGLALYSWLVLLILITGIMNTFNFMDGINGITILYSIVVLISIYIFQSIEEVLLIDDFFYQVVIISLVILGMVNVRTKAIAFLGDVGSVVVGLICGSLTLGLVITTQNPLYILIIGVYGIDSVGTIVLRLLRGENIMKPHRLHIYQKLANEKNLGHLPVSFSYATIQFIVCLMIYLWISSGYAGFWGLLFLGLPLVMMYICVRKVYLNDLILDNKI